MGLGNLRTAPVPFLRDYLARLERKAQLSRNPRLNARVNQIEQLLASRDPEFARVLKERGEQQRYQPASVEAQREKHTAELARTERMRKAGEQGGQQAA